MWKAVQHKATLLLALLVILGIGTLSFPAEAGSSRVSELAPRGHLVLGEQDPWLKKSVLPYLFLTDDARLVGERNRMRRAVGLSRQQADTLAALAHEEFRAVMRIYRTSQERILQAFQGKGDVQQAVQDHNVKDQFGRLVTVPTSADLTPALAADLGLAPLQNSFITVDYYDLP